MRTAGAAQQRSRGQHLAPQATSAAGHLENPFQPFGKAGLCVYNKTAKRSYRVTYTNSTVAGSSAKVYIGEQSVAEKEAKRKEEEAAAKAEHKAEEKTASEKWKTEEKSKKLSPSRATKEAELRSKFEKEEENWRNEHIKVEEVELSKKEVTVASGQASC